jgi:hypothetical protein
MLIDIFGDSTSANTTAEECLIHLARCGIVANRVPGAAVLIELPDCAGPPLRVQVGPESNAAGAITSVSALLRRLAELGAIPVSVGRDEELLMSRLIDLGYL